MTKAGFRPEELDAPSLGTTTRVVLKRGIALEFLCVDGADAAVSDLTLSLSQRPIPMRSSDSDTSAMPPSPGRDQRWAIYSGVSGADGRLTIGGLTAGDYEIACPPKWIIVDGADDSQLRVDGDAALTLRFAHVVGYAVQFPTELTVTQEVNYRAPVGRKDVLRQIQRYRREFRSRHPSALIALGATITKEIEPATFRALLPSGEWISLERELVPYESLEGPEIASVDTTAVSGIFVEVTLTAVVAGGTTPRQSPFPECALIAVAPEDPGLDVGALSIRPGVPVLVPRGVYQLLIPSEARGCVLDPPRTVHIDGATGVDEILLELRRPLRRCLLDVHGNDGERIGDIDVHLEELESGDRFRVRASTSKVDTYLPVGRFTVSLKSAEGRFQLDHTVLETVEVSDEASSSPQTIRISVP